ncbi:MAG: ferritin family protein [Pelosinus sp.]|nr:ferritin family protein [Pelosinus sp.]
MEKSFSDLEGLRMAMEIEKRGAAFYKKAYDKVSESQAKAMFKALMEEEQEHFKTFTDFFNQIAVLKEAHNAEYLFDDEISKYLTVLVESHVFPAETNAERIINELESAENIIKLAMRAEKDSILLYDELAKYSKFDTSREIFLKLKNEEQGHVIEINAKLKQLIK